MGHEIRKTRPALVISPDEMNRHIGTVLVAPMTSKRKGYPSRASCAFRGVHGEVVLDQIRAVDKTRLVKKLGDLGKQDGERVLAVLQEMFAP